MSEEKVLADIAVKITQVLKNNLEISAGSALVKILDSIPELANDVNYTIELLFGIADKLGIHYTDGEDVIRKLQAEFNNAVSDIDWNNICQKIAQSIYYVARLLANLLPPKWKEVILIIVEAYDRLILA